MTEPFLFSDRLKGVRNKNERTIRLNPTIERKIHHEKVFALLALAALLLAAFAFPVLAEEPILGGWSTYTDNPTEIPTEALDALNAALDGLEGCVYKPIALLGTQIVAGTNCCFLCETTVVVPDAQPGYALVYVFDDLEGEHELLRVQEIEFSAFE